MHPEKFLRIGAEPATRFDGGMCGILVVLPRKIEFDRGGRQQHWCSNAGEMFPSSLVVGG